jgi:hypothetical protein
MTKLRPITKEDVLDAVIQALEHDFPAANVMGLPDQDRIVIFYKGFAPEVMVVDVALAEVVPT